MRGRYQRQSDRKGFWLTKRDMQIVEAVFEARYITTHQIAELLFQGVSYSQCRYRVRGLFDLGHLKKRTTYRTEPDILYLGLRGKRHIQKSRGLQKGYVEKVSGVGRKETISVREMSHDLTLADLYIAARRNCGEREWQLTWRNTRMLELAKLGVEPDAWLQVREGDKSRAAYLEFTDVMPPAKEMNHKLSGYEGLFDREGATRVLWVTTSKAKGVQLRDRVAANYYASYFYVSLIESKEGLLTEPIWRVGGKRQPAAFIPISEEARDRRSEMGGEEK